MAKEPKILTRTILATSRLFSIEQLHLRFSNGEERYFERLVSRSKGAVLIVPMLDHETIILVREYAAGLERYELGFPKGVIEADEDSLTAANRELQEETGFGSKNLQKISTMTAAPGFWGSRATVILAQELYESRLPGDEPEPIEIIPWRLDDYRALLKRPDFTEARSIAALLLVKEMFAS